MDYAMLVPIALFAAIAYSIKAVVDARVRKQLVASNGAPDLVRSILEGDESNRRLASLRWGITLVALAPERSRPPYTPRPIGGTSPRGTSPPRSRSWSMSRCRPEWSS